ncbi:MAG: hypothetical protein DRP00_02100, partial [Candidatus Aenigmatarchaeota archaeon]
MSEPLIARVLRFSDKYVVTCEVPPGVGKTTATMEKALDRARNGITVIFALPNHTALLTAFSYAILSFTELMKKTPMKKMPYIVYYEGINRFCPFFKRNGEKLFKYALDYMLKKGFIDQILYDRLKDLSLSDVVSIYGTLFLCKYLCPIYKEQKHFNMEKIFATENVKNIESKATPLAGEARSYIVEASEKLGTLEKNGLVAYITPKFDVGKKPEGYCLRAILLKTVKKKTQLVMKGALILTPVQAVDFIHSIIENRIKVLRSKGLPIPYPYVIFDEYDFYVYKPGKIPLFTLKYAEKELEIALKIIGEEKTKRLNGDPSFDWERLVAAMVAALVLKRLKKEYEKFKEECKARTSLAPAGSIANIFIEATVEPVVFSDSIV